LRGLPCLQMMVVVFFQSKERSIDELHAPHMLRHLYQELCEPLRLEVVVLEATLSSYSKTTILLHVLEFACQHVFDRRLEAGQVRLGCGEVVGSEGRVGDRGAGIAVCHGMAEGSGQDSAGSRGADGGETKHHLGVVVVQEAGEEVELVGLEGVEGERYKIAIGRVVERRVVEVGKVDNLRRRGD
jgi:hypothetical protein